MTDAPIDFESFAAEILAPWFDPGAEQPAPAAEHTDPKLAAARALHAAVVEHAGKRGTIRLVCADTVLARSAGNYLEAFLEQPMLKGMVRKVTSDGVQLGNVAIEVTSNDVRAVTADVLAVVRLTAREAVKGLRRRTISLTPISTTTRCLAPILPRIASRRRIRSAAASRALSIASTTRG